MQSHFEKDRPRNRPRLPCNVYFSCPHFTVHLSLDGPIIVKAAPLVRVFEGQTIDALTAWAKVRFGEPIVVEMLN